MVPTLGGIDLRITSGCWCVERFVLALLADASNGVFLLAEFIPEIEVRIRTEDTLAVTYDVGSCGSENGGEKALNSGSFWCWFVLGWIFHDQSWSIM